METLWIKYEYFKVEICSLLDLLSSNHPANSETKTQRCFNS